VMEVKKKMQFFFPLLSRSDWLMKNCFARIEKNLNFCPYRKKYDFARIEKCNFCPYIKKCDFYLKQRKSFVFLYTYLILGLRDRYPYGPVMSATRKRSRKQRKVIRRVSNQLRKCRSMKQSRKEKNDRMLLVRKLRSRGDCLLPSLQGLINLDRREHVVNLKDGVSSCIYMESKNFRKLEDWILEKAADGAEEGGYAIELLKLIGEETDQAISMYRNDAATGWSKYWNTKDDLKKVKKQMKKTIKDMEISERIHHSHLDNIRARYALQRTDVTDNQ